MQIQGDPNKLFCIFGLKLLLEVESFELKIINNYTYNYRPRPYYCKIQERDSYGFKNKR